MSTTVSAPVAADFKEILRVWWPIIIGLLAVYIPTFYTLANGLWQRDEQAHAPIIFLVCCWLVWNLKENIPKVESRPAPIAGWAAILFGLLCYVLGHSQDIVLLDVGSQIPVLVGILLIMHGWGLVRTLWFPLFFLVFMVPIPGFIMDALTVPLKHYVSVLAEAILYNVGYPIARNGVVLTIGQYQLLVADACSGLNSMFSLTALGVLYVYLLGDKDWIRGGILLSAVLPIAFVANIIRVMILVLVTYHLGDETGQGFVHGFAGMVLFVIALVLLFALDGLLVPLVRFFRRAVGGTA